MDAAGVDREVIALAAAVHRPEEWEIEEQGPRPLKTKPKGPHWSRPWVLGLMAAATILLAAVAVFQIWYGFDTYETGVGEQRLVVLKDGTRMSLNTSTRVRVELDEARRYLSVEGGEALFEVAKDSSRPFVVQAAGTEVTATGTAFMVRLVPSGAGVHQALDVTLVEGQVVVQGKGGKATSTIAQPIVMAAGDRLRVHGDQGQKGAPHGAGAAPVRDRPRMDQVLAWKRGEVIFDDVSLPEAIAEMSRYSETRIVVDVGLREHRVSGVFRTGDSVGFARAVAALHGLAVRERAGQIELAPT